MARYYKLAFEAPLTEAQEARVEWWCSSHLFRDAWLDADRLVMYFAMEEPRTLRELQSLARTNFKRWGIPCTPYRRGLLTELTLEEYEASPKVRGDAKAVVQSAVAKALANVAARNEKARLLSARSSLGPSFKAFRENAKDAREARRQLKIRLQRLERVVSKPARKLAQAGLFALRRNAQAHADAARKAREEKVEALTRQFLSLTGFYCAVAWPDDLSNVRSVYDVPQIAHMLP